MTAKEFVELFYTQKQDMLKSYFSGEKDSKVEADIDKLGLNKEQMEIMKTIIDTALVDTFYTVLLGLDGSASIGGVQQTYDIYDEDGCKISDCGDIEAYAWEYFQEEYYIKHIKGRD